MVDKVRCDDVQNISLIVAPGGGGTKGGTHGVSHGAWHIFLYIVAA